MAFVPFANEIYTFYRSEVMRKAWQNNRIAPTNNDIDFFHALSRTRTIYVICNAQFTVVIQFARCSYYYSLPYSDIHHLAYHFFSFSFAVRRFLILSRFLFRMHYRWICVVRCIVQFQLLQIHEHHLNNTNRSKNNIDFCWTCCFPLICVYVCVYLYFDKGNLLKRNRWIKHHNFWIVFVCYFVELNTMYGQVFRAKFSISTGCVHNVDFMLSATFPTFEFEFKSEIGSTEADALPPPPQTPLHLSFGGCASFVDYYYCNLSTSITVQKMKFNKIYLVFEHFWSVCQDQCRVHFASTIKQ